MSEHTITLIQPARVERDADGCWWHPDLPDLDEATAVESWGQWLEAQQLQVHLLMLEHESPELFEQYLASDGGFEFWQPQAPEGGEWFLLSLADTEDGPAAWWARRVAA